MFKKIPYRDKHATSLSLLLCADSTGDSSICLTPFTRPDPLGTDYVEFGPTVSANVHDDGQGDLDSKYDAAQEIFPCIAAFLLANHPGTRFAFTLQVNACFSERGDDGTWSLEPGRPDREAAHPSRPQRTTPSADGSSYLLTRPNLCRFLALSALMRLEDFLKTRSADRISVRLICDLRMAPLFGPSGERASERLVEWVEERGQTELLRRPFTDEDLACTAPDAGAGSCATHPPRPGSPDGEDAGTASPASVPVSGNEGKGATPAMDAPMGEGPLEEAPSGKEAPEEERLEGDPMEKHPMEAEPKAERLMEEEPMDASTAALNAATHGPAEGPGPEEERTMPACGDGAASCARPDAETIGGRTADAAADDGGTGADRAATDAMSTDATSMDAVPVEAAPLAATAPGETAGGGSDGMAAPDDDSGIAAPAVDGRPHTPPAVPCLQELSSLLREKAEGLMEEDPMNASTAALNAAMHELEEGPAVEAKRIPPACGDADASCARPDAETGGGRTAAGGTDGTTAPDDNPGIAAPPCPQELPSPGEEASSDAAANGREGGTLLHGLAGRVSRFLHSVLRRRPGPPHTTSAPAIDLAPSERKAVRDGKTLSRTASPGVPHAPSRRKDAPPRDDRRPFPAPHRP